MIFVVLDNHGSADIDQNKAANYLYWQNRKNKNQIIASKEARG